MTISKEQQAINQSEWENPENWSGSIFGIYFSKKDSRVWVPKKPPWMGMTLNLAHPAGVRWLLFLLLLPTFILIGVIALIGVLEAH